MTSSTGTVVWRSLIRDVPGFPRPGIVFKDITPLLGDPVGLAASVDELAAPFENHGVELVAAPEARGFVIGGMAAERLGAGFVPLRKPGKLPRPALGADYELEYGTERLEMHTDAITDGARVLIVDDVLATGGTGAASAQIVTLGGGEIVGFSFIVELAFLDGRRQLDGVRVESAIVVE
ncbi:MAG: adenine phosphoribosyltransferase [Acidimicrobiales bacterium]|nr:adenine phosphoribosyltransferase [Acidimicrobiaceae bacterium]MCY3893663.1 adenine phosphoribosyltransferase [Acidimicrobiaceae bacterium]MYA26610.1 adenine phosphoribosyltransferase [Acidimicrobiales bacterium]MYD82416.1 adenine phosphoribosyltransferase [Acidimicrobiales bacterium]MYJ66063.1 adenine phosphoribosyltransferase [Acidimicrobiales bacterium]